MISVAPTVPAYLKELPDDRRKALTALRKLIRKAAPRVKESMKYGLPHFELDGPLFALASQKHYISLYVADHALVTKHKSKIGKVDAGKCCIRFRRLDALDMDAIETMLTEAVKKHTPA